MTLRQLADVFHLHFTTVKDWEIKGTQPSYETLVKIALFFDVSTDYLLGLKDD